MTVKRYVPLVVFLAHHKISLKILLPFILILGSHLASKTACKIIAKDLAIGDNLKMVLLFFKCLVSLIIQISF